MGAHTRSARGSRRDAGYLRSDHLVSWKLVQPLDRSPGKVRLEVAQRLLHHIRGADTAEGVRIDPARVSTDFVADLPAVTAPLDGTLLDRVGDTLGTAGIAIKWRVPSITLNGNKTLTILGDVTLILTASTGSACRVANPDY